MVSPVLDIACLCAQWCGICRDYRAVFEQLAQALPGHRLRWIDIEDEAALVGDIDIDTFPSLLVAHEGRVCFAGPVLPRLGDAQRLIEALLLQLRQALHEQNKLHAPPEGDAQSLAWATLACALMRDH